MSSSYQRLNINGTQVVHKVGSYVVIKAHKKAIPVNDFLQLAQLVYIEEGTK